MIRELNKRAAMSEHGAFITDTDISEMPKSLRASTTDGVDKLPQIQYYYGLVKRVFF